MVGYSETVRRQAIRTSTRRPENGVTEMVRRLIYPVWTGRSCRQVSRRIIDMQIRSVGIDLGKTTFHLVALGDNGKVLLKKKFYSEAANHVHG